MTGHATTVETEIEASPARVWKALTDPDEIEKYMFGSHVVTDWRPGSSIVWKGEYDGKTYEDKGEILESRARATAKRHALQPAGRPGRPSAELPHGRIRTASCQRRATRVTINQDNNPTPEAAEHSKANWERMLSGLKRLVEQNPS